jgi:hypothetical protein
MFFVPCPRCSAAVEIPSDAVGPARDDPWNVAYQLKPSLRPLHTGSNSDGARKPGPRRHDELATRNCFKEKLQ